MHISCNDMTLQTIGVVNITEMSCNHNGVASNFLDDYCCLGWSTVDKTIKMFCIYVREFFKGKILRQPTHFDILHQMSITEGRGWLGMFASLDCMHWRWKRCPNSWVGQYVNKSGNKSIILEVVDAQSLWIRHAYFGVSGSKNDLNILDRSPLIRDIINGKNDGISFRVNGYVHNRYYLLTNGIYPQWSCFVQTIHEPQDEKRSTLPKKQETTNKKLEMAFRVLQTRWAIIQNPGKQWKIEALDNIIKACIIIYNMVVEDEQHCDLELSYNPSAHNLFFEGWVIENLLKELLKSRMQKHFTTSVVIL